MAHFLFVPIPVAGHITPALELARRVVAKGNEATVFTGPRFRESVERVGARLEAYRSAPDVEWERLNELFPERPQKPGLAQAKWDLKEVMIGLAAQQHPDLSAVAEECSPDVIVADMMALSGHFVAETNELPLAMLNVLNVFAPSANTFPDGFGLPPTTSPIGKLRNRFANWVVFDLMLRDVNRRYLEVRRQLGLPTRRAPAMGVAADAAQLILQPTVPEFEYPREDLPPHLHFIGALLPPPPASWDEPEWWPRLQEAKPVVLVTQGTVATNFDDLIYPTLQALADADVLVVVTTGNRASDEVKTKTASDNVVVTPFVPFSKIMPHVNVMVTNGGYGGIHYALTEGVPLVVAGQSEDKTETCARVAWSGVGINLKTSRPEPDALREAVITTLRHDRYRQRAIELKAKLEALGNTAGPDLLERLADTKRAVTRARG